MNEERLTFREVDDAAMELIRRAENVHRDRAAVIEIRAAAEELDRQIADLEHRGLGPFSLGMLKGLQKRIRTACAILSEVRP